MVLTPEDNERITRTGPGTPMGQVMRRYWLPALLAEELREPQGDPVRVRLLGEDLVAFRDGRGRIGLVSEYCCHRRASLFFGRNEEAGLRCVFHGWQYDVGGRCIDMPNEPAESTFKERIRLAAYPCTEAGGIIWAYMGPADLRPALPDLEWIRVPEGHRYVSKTYEECNYLQAVEGGLDTSHSSFLHRILSDRADPRNRATAPRLEVQLTDYGYRYASIRGLPEGDYVRVYHFVMPCQQMRSWAGSGGRTLVQGHLWVPIDHEHCWVYNWIYAHDGGPLSDELIRAEEIRAGRGPEDLLPGYRLKRNRHNDYLIDRSVQRTLTYTGIWGINTQDIAVQESMGAVCDRSQEHLASADLAIIAMRRLLLQAAGDVETQRAPVGVQGDAARSVRPAEKMLPTGTAWPEAMEPELAAQW